MERGFKSRMLAILGLAAGLSACATTAELPSQATLEANLGGHIEVLASDEFEGRFPGTAGGRKTIDYQVEALKSYGLEPGYLGSWEQPVTIVKTGVENPILGIRNGSKATVHEDSVFALGFPAGTEIKDAPLVVVDQDTVEEVGDMGGKVVLLNNPVPGDRTLGEVFQAGASAIVVVFNGEERLARVKAASGRSSWGLPGDAGSGSALIYVYSPDADDIEASLGSSFAALQAAAAASSDGVLETKQLITLLADQKSEEVKTANVIGRLPGTKPGSGAVMLLAHWDHLGSGDRCAPEGEEDRICNGAVDNASGVAAILEVARIMSTSEPIERDIYIMGNTAEELGLLGARAFADNPPIPLDNYVAAFSLDTLALAEANAPITVIGWGMSPLDDGIEKVVKKLGRELDVEDVDQRFARRHDGWALMQKGVPSVLTTSAFAARDRLNEFLSGNYHNAGDEYDENFEIGGLVSDIAYYVELLRYFGNTESYMPPQAEEAEKAEESGAGTN